MWKPKVALVGIAIAVAPVLGCLTAPLTKIMIATFPDFAETMAAAVPVSEGHGRLIVYSPPNYGAEAVRGAGSEAFAIENRRGALSSGSFVFTDLPVGAHELSIFDWRKGESLPNPAPIEFEISEGGFTFVEIRMGLTETTTRVVEKNEAEPLARELHHDGRKAAPAEQNDYWKKHQGP